MVRVRVQVGFGVVDWDWYEGLMDLTPEPFMISFPILWPHAISTENQE